MKQQSFQKGDLGWENLLLFCHLDPLLSLLRFSDFVDLIEDLHNLHQGLFDPRREGHGIPQMFQCLLVIQHLLVGKPQKKGRGRGIWILLASLFQDIDGLYVIFLFVLLNPLSQRRAFTECIRRKYKRDKK